MIDSNQESDVSGKHLTSSGRKWLGGSDRRQQKNDVSILLQSYLVSAIYNMESSSRQQNPSLERRTEGWTEVWGGASDAGNADNNGYNDPKYWTHENVDTTQSASSVIARPQVPLILVQYRPAWFEQTLLRMAKVPHVVINSPYIATQSTGQLPYLQDLSNDVSPALIGRNNPPMSSNPNFANNSILDYLQNSTKLLLHDNLTDDQQSMSHILSCLIESQLKPILLSLRYGDTDAWENVNRPQCLRAACCGKRSGRYSVGAWIQARCERIAALKELNECLSIDEALTIARSAYESLESQLQKHCQDNCFCYLLGTSEPTIVDASLFAHMADALSDVHLVTILADFPLLVSFSERIYEELFEYKNDDNQVEWKTWNYIENHTNSFQRLPQDTMSLDSISGDGKYTDALNLMQSLSLQKHNLQETLSITKERREKDNISKSSMGTNENSTWHRWRMGGSFFPDEDHQNKSSFEKETPLQEKWRKENKHNDEMWMSGVLAGTVLAIIFSSATAYS